MQLSLGNETRDFSEPRFSEIVELIHNQSKDLAGHAYEEELKIFISGPDLPNMTFTDLPGLITQDKQLMDSNTSVRQLVQSYMSRSNTTIVVVEPAMIEDFETSQVSPLLR